MNYDECGEYEIKRKKQALQVLNRNETSVWTKKSCYPCSLKSLLSCARWLQMWQLCKIFVFRWFQALYTLAWSVQVNISCCWMRPQLLHIFSHILCIYNSWVMCDLKLSQKNSSFLTACIYRKRGSFVKILLSTSTLYSKSYAAAVYNVSYNL